MEHVYSLQRYKGYLNAIANRKSGYANKITWPARFKAFKSPDFPDLFDHPQIPEHARASCEKDLYETIEKSHSDVFKLCRTQLEKPHLTIRANTLKTTRKELLYTLEKDYHYKVAQCEFAPNGIRFLKDPELSLF